MLPKHKGASSNLVNGFQVVLCRLPSTPGNFTVSVQRE